MLIVRVKVNKCITYDNFWVNLSKEVNCFFDIINLDRFLKKL